MAAVGDDIVRYVFTGEEEMNDRGIYILPRNITHLRFHESIAAIPGFLFREHPNIVEIYCHDGVRKIERYAFYGCPRLKRLVIPGVEVVEEDAFFSCEAVTDIECPKLEKIELGAFTRCNSLISINLPSVKVVSGAFVCCKALTEAKFGRNLESLEGAFSHCPALERITIPLKPDLFLGKFLGCKNLMRVDLVEESALLETIDALHFEEWRNDMNGVVAHLNRILKHEREEKAAIIRRWIRRVLRKIIDYKAQHRSLLSEASATLKLALPNDVVLNDVLPFLELPSHTFYGEDEN